MFYRSLFQPFATRDGYENESDLSERLPGDLFPGFDGDVSPWGGHAPASAGKHVRRGHHRRLEGRRAASREDAADQLSWLRRDALSAEPSPQTRGSPVADEAGQPGSETAAGGEILAGSSPHPQERRSDRYGRGSLSDAVGLSEEPEADLPLHSR